MKRSMGLRTQAASLTAGSAGRTTGLNDQWLLPAGAAATSVAGAAAPASIQARSTATRAASRGGPLGGIGLTPSAPLRARTIRLLPD